MGKSLVCRTEMLYESGNKDTKSWITCSRKYSGNHVVRSLSISDMTGAEAHVQVLSLTMLSPLLHLDQDNCSKGQHKPKMVTTCIESIHKLPVDEAPLCRPIAGNPQAGFEVAECSTMRLFLATPAMPSNHASQPCTPVPGAVDGSSRPQLQSCRCDSAGSSSSSGSRLSMGAVSRAEHLHASMSSCGGAMHDSHGMDSVSSSSIPDAPRRTVQGGTLDIPAGVSIDLQGNLVFSNVHFRGACFQTGEQMSLPSFHVLFLWSRVTW